MRRSVSQAPGHRTIGQAVRFGPHADQLHCRPQLRFAATTQHALRRRDLKAAASQEVYMGNRAESACHLFHCPLTPDAQRLRSGAFEATTVFAATKIGGGSNVTCNVLLGVNSNSDFSDCFATLESPIKYPLPLKIPLRFARDRDKHQAHRSRTPLRL